MTSGLRVLTGGDSPKIPAFAGGKEEVGSMTDVFICLEPVFGPHLVLLPVAWAVPFWSSTFPHHRLMQNGMEPLDSSVARISKAVGIPVEIQKSF